MSDERKKPEQSEQKSADQKRNESLHNEDSDKYTVTLWFKTKTFAYKCCSAESLAANK